MAAKQTQADDGETERQTSITTVQEAREYQARHWKEDIAILDGELDRSMNFIKATTHTSRHGFEGYHLHFSYKYVFECVTEAIRALGFEIVSMRMESYRDEADFLVEVRRTRPSMIQERRRIDPDHYLIDEKMLRSRD